MKRTYRLTALILVLLMLVNLSASATSTGISLDELNIDSYETMVAEASEDETILSEPCSDTNEYCAKVTELAALPTAQDRYEYMQAMYSTDAENVELEGTMLHYYYYKTEHSADGLICECDFPSLAPEYVPGALDVHNEDCPWTFANLSVAEQYAVVSLLTADEQAPYIATLSADQAAALETYTADQTSGTLSYPCEEKPEYCQFSVYSQMTATEIYNYFNDIYADENGEISELYAAMMLHYGEYHLDSNLICTCGEHPLPLPQFAVGSTSAHAADCPWYFSNLTTGEQYTLLSGASEEDKAVYMATLDSSAQEKLTRVNTTEYTASNDTASVQISAPSGSFAADYILSAVDAELSEAQQEAMDALKGLSLLSSFDISFADLMNEASKLQPVSPVQLTFTIDTANVTGSTLYVHHLKDNGDGTYTAELLGDFAVDSTQTVQTVTVDCPSFSAVVLSTGCDGTTENGCGFNYFITLNGVEREKELLKYYQTDDGYGGNELDGFIGCAVDNHMDEVDINTLICLCSGYEDSPASYHYGSLNHETSCVQWGGAEEEIPCPWHFNQLTADEKLVAFPALPAAEQKAILDTLETEEKAVYLATLDDAAKDKLNRVNTTDYTATGDGVNVQINAPIGAFEVDYLLNAAAAALNEAQQAAMDALTDMHLITAFDISFAQLADETVKLQPASPVQLTFTVNTAELEGTTLYVHHLKDNGDGTYTAELLTEIAVDKTQTTQTISVQSSEFSYYTVSDSCDGTACDGNGGTTYSYAAFSECTTNEESRIYLNNLYSAESENTVLEAFLIHLSVYHPDAVEQICTCAIYPFPEVGSVEHDVAGCPWADATAAELLQKVKDRHGETAVQEWLDGYVVTTDMLELALQANSLDSVLVVEGTLVYVRTGETLATYDSSTGVVTDIMTGLTFQIEELVLTPSISTEEESQS